MTNTRTSRTVALELEQAQEDNALRIRLSDAEARIKRLTPELEKVRAREEAAKIKDVEDMHIAAQEARFKGLSDLSIKEMPDAKSSSVLSSTIRISYTTQAWNADANATLPKVVTITGLAALDANVLSWIVLRHPDKIPASIKALAPDDIEAALDRYFTGLRRGFLVS